MNFGTFVANRHSTDCVSTVRTSGKHVVLFYRAPEPNGFLANTYPAIIHFGGNMFGTNEHFIMYQKCLIMDKDRAPEILLLCSNDTAGARRIGQSIRFNEREWTRKRREVALLANFLKFSQNQTLGRRLQHLGGGTADIIEASRDNGVWGAGIDRESIVRGDPIPGENMQGEVLMQVRRVLQENWALGSNA